MKETIFIIIYLLCFTNKVLSFNKLSESSEYKLKLNEATEFNKYFENIIYDFSVNNNFVYLPIGEQIKIFNINNPNQIIDSTSIGIRILNLEVSPDNKFLAVCGFKRNGDFTAKSYYEGKIFNDFQSFTYHSIQSRLDVDSKYNVYIIEDYMNFMIPDTLHIVKLKNENNVVVFDCNNYFKRQCHDLFNYKICNDTLYCYSNNFILKIELDSYKINTINIESIIQGLTDIEVIGAYNEMILLVGNKKNNPTEDYLILYNQITQQCTYININNQEVINEVDEGFYYEEISNTDYLYRGSGLIYYFSQIDNKLYIGLSSEGKFLIWTLDLIKLQKSSIRSKK